MQTAISDGPRLGRAHSAGPSFRTMVLVGEGEVRRVLLETSEGRGHSVMVPESFAEAMGFLSDSDAFDLLVIDLNAPGVELEEIQSRLKQWGSMARPFVMGVADSMTVSGLRGVVTFELDDFAHKPFSLAELNTRLALVVKRIRAKRESVCPAGSMPSNCAIFASAPGALLVASIDNGEVIAVNQAGTALLERFFGRGRNGGWGTVQSLIPGFAGSGQEGQLADFVPKDGKARLVEGENAAGQRWYLEVSGAPIRWGSVEAILLEMRDATHRVEREHARLQSGKAESISHFAQGLAHDINNILTAVSGNIGLLRAATEFEGKALEYLGNAEDACEKAATLVTRLSGFARDEEPEKEILDIRPILERVVKFSLFDGKSEPVFHIPEDLWDVCVEKSQFCRVVANLSVNARQAMSDGGKLEVRCGNVTIHDGEETIPPLPPGHYVGISFQDEGVGIPHENLEAIFDPYFTTKEEGTGIGLAMSMSIVDRHGGYMRVDSRPGRGSVFEFYLPSPGFERPDQADPAGVEDGGAEDHPLRTEVKNQENPKTMEPVTIHDPSGVSRRKRVLFLDDDPGIRSIISEVLSANGFEARCTARGEDAIAAYEEAEARGVPFDMLLLDLDVRGGLGGREVISRLRDKRPDLRAVVTSGYTDDEVWLNHQAYGFSGVLAKPFELRRLLDVVGEFCRPHGAAVPAGA